MIKVLYFLKRADNLTLEEFHEWWLDHHMPMVKKLQTPHLLKYTVNLRESDTDNRSGKPKEDSDWDGVAEMYYADEAGFEAAFGGGNMAESREDTLKHSSRVERLFVREVVAIA